MKYLFLIIFLLAFFGCANLISANRNSNEFGGNKKNVQLESNSVSIAQTETEESKADEDKLLKLETQNAKFKTVPDNFRKIDFTNYSYPYKFSDNEKKRNFQLEDGKYVYEFAVNDRGFISFNDVFYIDLTGDEIKEAIVLLRHFSCATGCDGGAYLFYIYSMQNNKPEIVWQYETGSLGYGEGLKSFTIENNKIIVEEFGLCEIEQPKPDSTPDISCGKYRAKDIVREIYAVKDGKFVLESKQKIETPKINVTDYKANISIND